MEWGFEVRRDVLQWLSIAVCKTQQRLRLGFVAPLHPLVLEILSKLTTRTTFKHVKEWRQSYQILMFKLVRIESVFTLYIILYMCITCKFTHVSINHCTHFSVSNERWLSTWGNILYMFCFFCSFVYSLRLYTVNVLTKYVSNYTSNLKLWNWIYISVKIFVTCLCSLKSWVLQKLARSYRLVF